MVDLGLSSTMVAIIALVGGVVVPFLTSVFKSADWPSWAKKVLAGVVATLSAVAVVFVDGDFTIANVLENALVLWTAAQVSYRNLWNGTPTEARVAGSFRAL